MDDSIQTRINQIAAEAKQRNPEGLKNYNVKSSDGGSVSSTSDEEKSQPLGKFVNPHSGQRFSLLATTKNVPLYLQELG